MIKGILIGWLASVALTFAVTSAFEMPLVAVFFTGVVLGFTCVHVALEVFA